MNEKEIIKDLKNFIALAQKEENFIYYSEYKFDNELAERVQGILDLYKQEKAKNKDLEQIEKEHKEENGRLREEIYKKDKIINLMGEHIENGCDFDNKIQTKQQILDYFTNKVEEDIK